jgi:cytochrome c oxidase cbb3-type subunit III
MWWRTVMVVSCLVIVGAALAFFRDERSLRPSVAAEAMRRDVATLSTLAAGQPAPPGGDNTRYENSGYDLSEGKRLYRWFNCNGCHANGGGDIGPALMDDKWIYGAGARNIYQTIVEGRPNGMPSFRNKIPEAQVWQIAGYVRSMSGLTPFYSRPSRNDDLQAAPPETMAPTQPPKPVTPEPQR